MSPFLQIKHEDAVPNDYTFAVVLNPSVSLSALGYGTSSHVYTEKSGFKGHVSVRSASINLYFCLQQLMIQMGIKLGLKYDT